MPFEIEVTVQKIDRHGGISLFERVYLPAKYNDALGAIVVAYNNGCQQVRGNREEGFYIAIY